jgi:type IV pilus assembly protein PilN
MENNGFIFVNLLPYREKQKAVKIKKFTGIVSSFAILGIALIGAGHFTLAIKLENQESRNSFIESENKKLDSTISSISNLREEIKLTLAKRKVVETLQTNRADGVNIINEIANNLPDDTSLKSIKKFTDKLFIVGQTSSNNKVSNYMMALEESDVFANPTLVEVKQVVLTSNPKDKKSKGLPDQMVNEFSIKLDMQKSEEELKRLAEEKKKSEKEQAKAKTKAKEKDK